MLKDDEIRAGLRRVADEIGVNAEDHLARLHAAKATGSKPDAGWGRRLAPVAAAATVAAVVAVGVSLSGVVGGAQVDAGSAAPALLSGTPDGTVPSVFGHTRDTAQALLASRGFGVRFGEQISCEPEGRPVATDPTLGAPASPGDTITVLLGVQGATVSCAADLRGPWAFVDFATGRGPAPEFADDLALFVDGEPAASLSRAEAARGQWGRGSALDILRTAAAQVLRGEDGYLAPSLRVVDGTPPDSSCAVARPEEVGGREATTLTIEFAENATAQRCPAQVALYATAGVIDTVVAWSPKASEGLSQPIPDVVGLPLSRAREAITAAGYSARVEELEICQPRDGVVEQAPTAQDIEDDRADDPNWVGPVTLVVEIPHTTRDCAALDAAAAGFLRFARGGEPPVWAPQVQQLLGYAPWATVSAASADQPGSWSLCSGVTPEECEVSALVVAGRDGEVTTGEFSDVTRWPDGQDCEYIDRGGLPTGLAVEQQIVLYPAQIAACDQDWSVWLWIDDQGRIEAVNLLVPAT